MTDFHTASTNGNDWYSRWPLDGILAESVSIVYSVLPAMRNESGYVRSSPVQPLNGLLATESQGCEPYGTPTAIIVDDGSFY